ncbi:MAG: WD40 repeat domain-containing protein [Kofleriaceae bacterium]
MRADLAPRYVLGNAAHAWSLSLILLAACGRFGFDSQPPGDSGVVGDGKVTVDDAGNVMFDLEIVSAQPSEIDSVAELPDGRLAIAASVRGNAMFDGLDLTYAGGATDAFFAVIDNAGKIAWSHRIATAERDGAYTIIVAGDQVVVTGAYAGPTDFGDGAIHTPTKTDAFIAAYTFDGALNWVRTFGGTAADPGGPADYVEAVAATPDGDLVVAGSVIGSVDFGNGATAPVSANHDLFVARYSPNGQTLRWVDRFGGTGDVYDNDLAVASDATIGLVGGYDGTLDLGGGAVPSVGAEDGFFLELADDGSYRYAGMFGTTAEDGIVSIAAIDTEFVIAVGSFGDIFSYTNVGQSDFVLAAFDAGTPTTVAWSIPVQTPGCDYIGRMTSVAGQITLGGAFDGNLSIDGTALQRFGKMDGAYGQLTKAGAVESFHSFGTASDDVVIQASPHAVVGTELGSVDCATADITTGFGFVRRY